MFFYAIMYIAVSCLMGFFTRKIASDKGHDSIGYFWLGFFLEVIGIIIAACLSDQRQQVVYVQQQDDRNDSRENTYGLNSAPSGWTCGHCHQHNSGALNYCIKCRRDRNENRTIPCPSCGKDNRVGNANCFSCNYPLTSSAPESAASQPAPPPPAPRTCPSCHAENTEDSKFCKNCGSALETEEKPACPSCGHINQSDAAFCVSCGARLDGTGSPRGRSTPL